MSNGFLFPGQGSQSIGMGKELYETLPEAKRLLDDACDMLGYDLKKLMFEGPMEELTDTRYAQPAIYTCSAMYLEKARKQGLTCDYAAGHSLGEYSALYAVGVLSFKDGLFLVDKRGRTMGAENGKGIMAAVLGMTEDELRPFMDEEAGVVMANLNTRNQIVISGVESGIHAIAEKLNVYENVTIKKLNVSAAFHSPQMERAAEIMKAEIGHVEMHEPSAFVVSNVTGQPTNDPGIIRKNLLEQITGQVRWYDSMIAMKDAGVEAFYEVGNGNVLKKMNKAIMLRPKCFSI